MFFPLFPHITLVLVFLLLMFSLVAYGGAISSSGAELPVAYTCRTLPEGAARGLALRVEWDRSTGGLRVVVVENRGVELAPAAFPAPVVRTRPASPLPSPGWRFVGIGAGTGVRVELLVDERVDFWTATHYGTASFDAPAAPGGFHAFLACRAAPQAF